MRALVLLLIMATACSKKTESSAGSATATNPVGSATATKSGGAALDVDHITMLQPEAVVEARVADQDAFTDAVKAAKDLVIAYDRDNPGALPPDLDVFVVARAGAIRAWLVGPGGDVSVPKLESSIAALPKVAVKDSNVAVAMTMARGPAEKRNLYLPAAWKAAAAPGGSEMSDTIEKAWPR
jgi:hypothetical protein